MVLEVWSNAFFLGIDDPLAAWVLISNIKWWQERRSCQSSDRENFASQMVVKGEPEVHWPKLLIKAQILGPHPETLDWNQ